MDITQYVLLAAVIAGATELITQLRARDYWKAVTIVVSASIGGLFGLIGYYPHLDVLEGIAAGFGASGAITAVSHLGSRR